MFVSNRLHRLGKVGWMGIFFIITTFKLLFVPMSEGTNSKLSNLAYILHCSMKLECMRHKVSILLQYILVAQSSDTVTPQLFIVIWNLKCIVRYMVTTSPLAYMGERSLVLSFLILLEYILVNHIPSLLISSYPQYLNHSWHYKAPFFEEIDSRRGFSTTQQILQLFFTVRQKLLPPPVIILKDMLKVKEVPWCDESLYTAQTWKPLLSNDNSNILSQ